MCAVPMAPGRECASEEGRYVTLAGPAPRGTPFVRATLTTLPPTYFASSWQSQEPSSGVTLRYPSLHAALREDRANAATNS